MTEKLLLLENIMILIVLLKLYRLVIKMPACNHNMTEDKASKPRVFPRDDETLWEIEQGKKGAKNG